MNFVNFVNVAIFVFSPNLVIFVNLLIEAIFFFLFFMIFSQNLKLKLKIDLSFLDVESEPLKSAVEALAEHRTEQAAIEQQIQSLMEKSLKRREQFR